MSAVLILLAIGLLAWPATSRAEVRATALAAAGRLPARAPTAPTGRRRLAGVRLRRWPARSRGARAVDDGTLRAVALLAHELRAGANPARAWAGAAATAGPESAGWMTEVAAAAAAGRPIGPAVTAAARELAHGSGPFGRERGAALERLGAAWACGAGAGSSAADMLDHWLADAQARRRLEGEIDSQLAGSRASTALLAALPLLGLALGAAMGADPLGLLLGTPAGVALLAIGAALEAAGLLWVRRIIVAARRA